MFKKAGFKIGFSFVFALLILTALKTMNAYAATKEVTISQTQTVDAPESQIGVILQSISTSTYNYDDGTYKGTLSCTNAYVVSRTKYQVYPTVTIYRYTVNVTYSGTVTEKVVQPPKAVTVSYTQTFQAPESQIGIILNEIAKSSYMYQDTTHKGSIPCVSVGPLTKTLAPEYPNYPIYNCTVQVIYSGTVYGY